MGSTMPLLAILGAHVSRRKERWGYQRENLLGVVLEQPGWNLLARASSISEQLFGDDNGLEADAAHLS